MATVLCVSVEPAVAVILESVLVDLGHTLLSATTVVDALQTISHSTVDIVIAGSSAPEPGGYDMPQALRDRDIDTPVIVVASHASVEDAVAVMRRGAADYLTTPLRAESVRIAVSNALEVHRLRRTSGGLHRDNADLRGGRVFAGESAAHRRILAAINAAAPARSAVLLEGESGTGKYIVAREIHERSSRRDHPFVTVDCATLASVIAEGAIFSQPLGAFEQAAHGTLCLQEIAELPFDLQAMLLHAMQAQDSERVGDALKHHSADVRLIATTNRDLGAEVEAGRFRRELYYRLNVVRFRMPALRQRVEDIPALARHFAQRVAADLGIEAPTVPQETVEFLQSRPWPGNVRELANLIERAMILRPGPVLHRESLDYPHPARGAASEPFVERPTTGPVVPADVSPAEVVRESEAFNLHRMELEMIHRALVFTGGRKAKAAELLGINERTLRNKLKAEKTGA